jgi:transposase InsO family protein
MPLSAIRAKTVKQWRATTDSAPQSPVVPNTRNRQVAVAHPKQGWAGDSTSGWTAEGWLSLAVVLALYARRGIAGGRGSRLTQELATAALTRAMEHRRPTSGVWQHPDRGAPSAATLYRERFAGYGLPASMSRRGHCWANAVVERFVHTLKPELVEHRRDITREEARQDMFAWIAVFSNRTRRHATRGYRSPAECEAMAMRA